MSVVLSRDEVTKVSLDELLAIYSKFNGQINRVYWHWSAGRYGQFWEDYPVNIDEDGTLYIVDSEDVEARGATWHRNSGSTAIGTLCMMNANTSDFGEMPLTDAQIEASAKVMAVISIALNLPITDENFLTHAEIALIDGYGPGQGDPETRWDGYFLHVGEEPGSGGNILRGKANYYLCEFRSKLMKGLSLES